MRDAFLSLQILRFGAYSHVDAGNLDRRGRAGRFSLCRHVMAFLGIGKMAIVPCLAKMGRLPTQIG